MLLTLNDDQRAIMDALDNFARPFEEKPIEACGFVLESQEFDAELAGAGFLEVGHDPDLGLVTAALVVERLARLPYVSEIAASAIIGPSLGEATQRPLCLANGALPAAPVRFLRPGARILVLDGESAVCLDAGREHVETFTDTLYAYPVARLAAGWRETDAPSIDAKRLVTGWRIALAAEAAGLLRGGIDSTVRYVSERKQFGRPIAAFQAVRHRLAEAHTRAEGVRWLSLKAAATEDGAEAALAAHFAQDAAGRVIYDLHQFLGAMGVTLEHPLHLWTYRLKALTAELGGSMRQAMAAGEALGSAGRTVPCGADKRMA